MNVRTNVCTMCKSVESLSPSLSIFSRVYFSYVSDYRAHGPWNCSECVSIELVECIVSQIEYL